MAKLSVVIFAICFMCLLVFDGVFAADDQTATTVKVPVEAVTSSVTTPPSTKPTIKSADTPIQTEPSKNTPEKEEKTKDLGAGAQPSTQTTEASKAPENTDPKGKDNGSSAVVANAMLFVSAVYMCTRF